MISRATDYSQPAIESGRDATRATRRRLSPQIAPHVQSAMAMLLQAYEYAQDVDRNRWEFAIGFDELRRAGLTTADCRWLVCKGWSELARELTPQPGVPRRFRHDVGLAISQRSCFVLTDSGVQVVRRMGRQDQAAGRSADSASYASALISMVRPHWDRDRHELRLGDSLIKQFKLPSPNQEMILMALEEENWPVRIDDPLPPSKKLDAKQRLHDTIKNLNRNQKHRLIRFMGDGTGQGVRWELIAEHNSSPAETSEPKPRPR